MSDWLDYNENLAFDPNNSMPGCDIEELKTTLQQLKVILTSENIEPSIRVEKALAVLREKKI